VVIGMRMIAILWTKPLANIAIIVINMVVVVGTI
jgi:hypothetical protein